MTGGKVTPEEHFVRKCYDGDRANIGTDLPDIFWLMGWADWEIERQLLTDETLEVQNDQTKREDE